MIRISSAASVLVLWLAAGGASAQAPASRLIEEAAGAFAGLDFERALGLLEKALRTGEGSPGDVVRIYSLRGLCLVSLGKEGLARQSFRAALAVDPGFRLAPDLSPRFQEPFREELGAGVPPLSLRIDFPSQFDPDQEFEGLAHLSADPEGLAGSLLIFYRPAGHGAFSKIRLRTPSETTVTFRVEPPPASLRGADSLEWYAELHDKYGNRLLLRGDAEHPLRVPLRRVEKEPLAPAAAPAAVAPTPSAWYSKWWVWAIVGTLAAAAGGATVGVLLSQPAPHERDFTVEIR